MNVKAMSRRTGHKEQMLVFPQSFPTELASITRVGSYGPAQNVENIVDADVDLGVFRRGMTVRTAVEGVADHVDWLARFDSGGVQLQISGVGSVTVTVEGGQ